MTHRRRAAALVVAVLASCAEDRLEDAPSTSDVGPPSPVSISSPGELPDAGVPDTRLPDSAPPTTSATMELGTCEVVVEGDEAGGWQGLGGESAIVYGPWIDDIDQRPSEADDVALDSSLFVLSCRGPGARTISFTANAPVPQRPATYPFTVAGGLGQSPSDRLIVATDVDGTARRWSLAAPGQLDIERFDDERLVATFDVTVVADDVVLPVRLTGSFDLANPDA